MTEEPKGPVEGVEEVVREVERGASDRTPFLLLHGVALVIAVVVAVIAGVALLVYFLVK